MEGEPVRQNGSMQSSRKGRVARGAAAASVATFAALGFHVTAGGAMPGLLGVAVPWVLSVMVCTLLAGRRLSSVRLSLAVALSQFLFHALFVVGMVDPALASGHSHSFSFAQSPGSLTLVPGAGSLAVEPVMAAAHLLAAAVTVAAIHRGEALLLGLRTLAAQCGEWMRELLAMPVCAPLVPVRLGAPESADARALSRSASRLPRRRGPPLPV